MSEPELVTRLFTKFETENSNIESNLNSIPRSFNFAMIVKNIPTPVQHKGGLDFVIITYIDLPEKNVLKAGLFEAKKLIGPPTSHMSRSEYIRLTKSGGQLETLNSFPERAGYLFFFMSRDWKQFQNSSMRYLTQFPYIRVMPSLDFSYFKNPPLLKDISSSCRSFQDFLINGILGTPEGSPDVIELGEGRTVEEQLDNSKIVTSKKLVYDLSNYPRMYFIFSDPEREEQIRINHVNERSHPH
ncbi:MAG: hypothetical protein HeimC2_28380 [Candidatus Heimdallarchaeota archaeon LC_2]|nr:MAG: hypothetical protein HeimC2_28380 [Candidatus Heimdallarchaeota archaeon LC_2]